MIKNKTLIKPEFITGFTNADGSFQIKITHRKTMKYKHNVRPVFTITQKDRVLLDEINNYFNNQGHLVRDKRTDT
jgi:hypothetical protein